MWFKYWLKAQKLLAQGIALPFIHIFDNSQHLTSAITLQKETLTGGRRALFPVKDECRLYRLDVVVQALFSIVRHLTL